MPLSELPPKCVRLIGDEVLIRPIAGTRPRGKNKVEDSDLAEELLADEKERAEHLMLVDLARNDIGRVCQPGTVRAAEYMTIERYSPLCTSFPKSSEPSAPMKMLLI